MAADRAENEYVWVKSEKKKNAWRHTAAAGARETSGSVVGTARMRALGAEQDADDKGEPLLDPTGAQAPRLRACARPRALLVYAIVVASFLPFGFGYALGFTSPALDPMSRAFAPPLSTAERATFSSLVNVGAMLASLGAGSLTDAWGRRRAMGCVAVVGAVGWSLIVGSLHLGRAVLLVGRLLTGCAAGGSSVCVNVYIAEISPTALRGALGASFQVSVTLGILGVYALGIPTSWRVLAALGAVPYALVLLGLPWLPETPRWELLVRKDEPAARRTLRLLRPSALEAEAELDELLAQARAPPGGGAAEGGGSMGDGMGYAPPRPSPAAMPPSAEDALEAPAASASDRASPGRAASDPSADEPAAEGALAGAIERAPADPAPAAAAPAAGLAPARFEPWMARPLAIAVVLMVCQQLSGINAVIFYSQQILRDASFVSFAADASLIVACAQAAVTIVSVPLMDACGRRALLLAAAAGMGVSQAVISVFFLSGKGAPSLALLGLCGSVGAFSLGFGAIPWSIMAELFPQRVRGLASSIATLTNWSFSFLVTLTFEDLARALGEGSLFALYAVTCAGTVVFVSAFVPETRHRTLEQIEAEFRRRHSRDGRGWRQISTASLR